MDISKPHVEQAQSTCLDRLVSAPDSRADSERFLEEQDGAAVVGECEDGYVLRCRVEGCQKIAIARHEADGRFTVVSEVELCEQRHD